MMNVFHEMVYKESRCEPQVLAHGFYHGRNYYVVSFGTYPCAYIDVSDLWGKTWEEQKYLENVLEDTIDCHGKMNYSDTELVVEDKTGWYIGWDYDHSTDYNGNIPYKSLAKKWTTSEIVSECKGVIDQIEGLVKELTKKISGTTFQIVEPKMAKEEADA